MSDDILNTIEVLTKRVGAKEEEANKLKKLVNELCGEAGITARFPNIAEANGSIGTIRSDQFYGQTITAAIRNYLEQRKASGLGAAGLNEIFTAVRDGGYKFESKNEVNAKTSIGNTLRKTSSIFHRLPNGQYGLLTWYPSAKVKPEIISTPKNKSTKNKAKGKIAFVNEALLSGKYTKPEIVVMLVAGYHVKEKTAINTVNWCASKLKKQNNGAPSLFEFENGKTATNDSPTKGQSLVTNKEIRDIVLEQQGDFQTATIEAAVKAKFPTKEFRSTKIASMIFILKGKGLIKAVSERAGSKPAVYAKV